MNDRIEAEKQRLVGGSGIEKVQQHCSLKTVVLQVLVLDTISAKGIHIKQKPSRHWEL